MKDIINRSLKVPGVGRVGVFREPSGLGVGIIGGSRPQGYLTAKVIRNGQPVKANKVMSFASRFWNNIHGNSTVIDLGSGLVTNVGVLALANDWSLAAPSGAAINTLKLANWHFTGTG